jgi:hypothetical protein
VTLSFQYPERGRSFPDIPQLLAKELIGILLLDNRKGLRHVIAIWHGRW